MCLRYYYQADPLDLVNPLDLAVLLNHRLHLNLVVLLDLADLAVLLNHRLHLNLVVLLVLVNLLDLAVLNLDP